MRAIDPTAVSFAFLKVTPTRLTCANLVSLFLLFPSRLQGLVSFSAAFVGRHEPI
jgi:hypothetical protein